MCCMSVCRYPNQTTEIFGQPWVGRERTPQHTSQWVRPLTQNQGQEMKGSRSRWESVVVGSNKQEVNILILGIKKDNFVIKYLNFSLTITKSPSMHFGFGNGFIDRLQQTFRENNLQIIERFSFCHFQQYFYHFHCISDILLALKA